MHRAWQSVAQRDIPSTMHWFRQALTIKPNHAEALAGLGQALCWQDKVKEGLSYLNQAAQELEKAALKKGDIHFVIQLAEQLHHWGDLETSIKLTQLAVKLQPNSAAAHNNLALYLSRVNRLQEALPHAYKAHQLAPTDLACNNLLASLESRQGLYNEAKIRFEKIAKQSQNLEQSARAWQELATVLDKLGEYEQAFSACEQGKLLHHGFVEAKNIDAE
ncbi:MAG: tetratricopeptide repeat protein, partial [Methylococcales bacterium]